MLPPRVSRSTLFIAPRPRFGRWAGGASVGVAGRCLPRRRPPRRSRSRVPPLIWFRLRRFSTRRMCAIRA
eukprot:903257-Lingulodinium_polyedra.AAC.1